VSNLWLTAVVALGTFGAGQATPVSPPRASAPQAFLSQLQRAVAADDRRAVAALVQYPVTVLVSGLQVPISDAAAFVKIYDVVFTPDLQELVAQTSVARRGQPPSKYAAQVVENGMTIGAGAVWVQQVGASYKIGRIVVPPAGTVRKPRAAATRVTFPNGITSQLSGMLSRRNEAESYLVKAQQGQSLRVSITGFRGSDAALRVFDAGNRPIPSSGPGGPRVWNGPIPATGDYRIEVVRSAPDSDPALLFVLSVTLR
jgi:hypothetical protein